MLHKLLRDRAELRLSCPLIPNNITMPLINPRSELLVVHPYYFILKNIVAPNICKKFLALQAKSQISAMFAANQDIWYFYNKTPDIIFTPTTSMWASGSVGMRGKHQALAEKSKNFTKVITDPTMSNLIKQIAHYAFDYFPRLKDILNPSFKVLIDYKGYAVSRNTPVWHQDGPMQFFALIYDAKVSDMVSPTELLIQSETIVPDMKTPCNYILVIDNLSCKHRSPITPQYTNALIRISFELININTHELRLQIPAIVKEKILNTAKDAETRWLATGRNYKIYTGKFGGKYKIKNGKKNLHS